MDENTFKSLRYPNCIKLIEDTIPRVYTVIESAYDSGTKIEIVRHKTIKPSSIEKWLTLEGKPIKKIDDLVQWDRLHHKSSGFTYLVELVALPFHASCMHMRQLNVTEAINWELHTYVTADDNTDD